jgi:hypothetical protein
VYLGRKVHNLPALEQDEFVLAQVKGDIAVFVGGQGGPNSRARKAMPMWFVFLVKFLFYIRCNILKKDNVSTFGNSQKTIQPTNQQNNQPNNQPNNQRTKSPKNTQTTKQQTKQTNNQQNNEPNNQLNNQTTNQTANQTNKQKTNEQPNKQPTKQPNKQSTKQPTDQARNFTVLTYPPFIVIFQCLVFFHCLFCTIHCNQQHFVWHSTTYDTGFVFKHLA